MRGATRLLILALVTIPPLAGCAALRGIQAKDTEQLLAAAGFRAEPADTPARLADLEERPPLKLVPQSKDGQVVYRYADPYRCRCVYVGGPAEYSAYERLVVDKRIADQWRDAELEWGPWAPWVWW
jgi:hypothetical protein